MAEKRVFTRSEIKKNDDNDKVLVILHDKVYNVHSFLNEHPGGEEILLEHKGKESSEDFDDVGHSKDAMEMMKKYQVGELIESERSNKSPKKGWVSGYTWREKTEKSSRTNFYLLISITILLTALTVYLL